MSEQPPAATQVLLARHRAGDSHALGELITRYAPRVRSMVQLRMGSALRAVEEVEDALQDVFVRVVTDAERFEERGDARFIDWVARLVEHELANHSRRERARKRGGDLEQQVRRHLESGTSCDIPAESTAVPSRVARREEVERMQACLAQLSPMHREVILQREYAGGDWRTVAEKMGRPSPKACQELHRRARIELARLMAAPPRSAGRP